MRIRITEPGIYGADGEIPVGEIMVVAEEPKGWAGSYEVISESDEEPDPTE